MGRRRIISLLLSFFCGVAVAASAPALFRLVASRYLFPVHQTEIARITSPDGQVDAIATRIECGAPCSSDYVVSIVPTGVAHQTESIQRVFVADEIANPQIKWSEPHMLTISYDKAVIQNFHNVVYPLGRPGNVESWRYTVEVILSPSSTRILTGSQAPE